MGTYFDALYDSHPSVKYARSVVEHTVVAPRYVIRQASDWLIIAGGDDPDYHIDLDRVILIDNILQLMIMPTGIYTGCPMDSALSGYQWLVIIASLATMHAKSGRRKYNTVILEICRKNFKTFTTAILFILLLLTEAPLSRFFSVAPDGALSREIKVAIDNIIAKSPALCGNPDKKIKSKFRVLKSDVTCALTGSKYEPLAFSTSRMDGREPYVFVADEVGGLPISYPIEAMRSGQTLIPNRLGFIISTKYPSLQNPMEDEVEYAKKVLNGTVTDDTLFALLYEPDNTKDWQTNDDILRQANPVAQEIPDVWDTLIRLRAEAIVRPSKRENFLCKHCNIIYKGIGTETYVDVAKVIACRVPHIDWSGRTIYVAMDLSLTNDNTSVMYVSWDADREKLMVGGKGFIPIGKRDTKTASERFDYFAAEQRGECIACGGETVGYDAVEDYVTGLCASLGASELRMVGFDRMNAISSAQKIEAKGIETVEIKQHSSVLHVATKWLSELIENGNIEYEPNLLLEQNFENARCSYDTNMNRYVHKKKSRGKVDMVVALINAAYLIYENEIICIDSFGAMY